MKHPFYQNKKLLLIYINIWIVISTIQVFVLFMQYHLPYQELIIDSLCYNFSFAVFGFSLWYLVKFFRSSKPGVFYLIMNHLTAASVLIIVWISLFKYLTESIFSGNEAYLLFSNSATIWRASFGVMMYGILVLLYFTEEYYSDLKIKTKNEFILKTSAREAELKMLKAQINPHFLFNSLNSISSLTLSDAGRAHEMIISLSDYFRYAISKTDNQITTLKAELENCKRYLEIEQIRFGSKLNIHFKTDNKSMECKLPTMILQPLYENAVKHGVYESLGEVSIDTVVSLKADHIEIMIQNDTEEMPKKKPGEELGLKNVKERLRLLYNSDDLINIKQIPGKFIVNLKIPCTPEN